MNANMETIHKIVHRAESYGKRYPGANVNTEQLAYDLMQVIAAGTPLDLDSLLAAGISSFYHDLIGITMHINRVTGELNGFSPVNVMSNAEVSGAGTASAGLPGYATEVEK